MHKKRVGIREASFVFYTLCSTKKINLLSVVTFSTKVDLIVILLGGMKRITEKD
jgi:hypothetical protein